MRVGRSSFAGARSCGHQTQTAPSAAADNGASPVASAKSELQRQRPSCGTPRHCYTPADLPPMGSFMDGGCARAGRLRWASQELGDVKDVPLKLLNAMFSTLQATGPDLLARCTCKWWPSALSPCLTHYYALLLIGWHAAHLGGIISQGNKPGRKWLSFKTPNPLLNAFLNDGYYI